MRTAKLAARMLTSKPSALTLQLLAWIAERPRTYAETLDAWKTSCPRLSIWEDALLGGLIAVQAANGAGQAGSLVVLTDAGRGVLRDYG